MMESPTALIAVCNQIVVGAESLVRYTNDLEQLKDGNPDVVKTFEEIQLDTLEHIQTLVVTLSGLMVKEEGEEDGTP